MTVFSRVLKKVSRWELPTPHHPRRALSSPSGQSLSASRSLKDVAAPYGLFDQETEQSDFATQLSEGRLGATRALIDQIVDDSGQLQSASHSLKDMAALHGLNKEKSGFKAEVATASHSFDELAAPCGYKYNRGYNYAKAAPSHSFDELAAPCGYKFNRGYNYAKAAPSSEEFTGASCDENSENTGALKTKCYESNTVSMTSRKNSIAVETMTFIVRVVMYYLVLLVYSLNLSDLFARSTPSLEASSSGTLTFYPYSPTCEVNTTRSSHTTITASISTSTTGKTMSFFTHLTVYYLILLVNYLVKKSKEYCGMFVTSPLNSSNSVSETAVTVSKVYTASSTRANNYKSFFKHLIVFYVILLIYSLRFTFSDPPVESSSNSKPSLSTTSAIFNFTSEANKTSTMSIWSASSTLTAGPTISFCTHVIVYYLMLLVYSFLKKAKECCVKFVRSFLNSSNAESAPSIVISPCNFCDRDMTYGEIMEQLEPAIYSPVTPLYTACECKAVDVENCLELDDNYKPCPNAWFDSRLHEKNKSLFEYFENSAIGGMLFDTQITVATAVELFGIPIPVSGSVLEVELLLYQLQDEYHFTLKCADCGDILSTPVICGGGRTKGTKNKKPKFGRKSKGKRKGAKAETKSAATEDIDIDVELDSTVSADDHEPDNDHVSILSHADSDIDILTSTAAFIDQDVTAESDDFDNTKTTDDCFNETMLSDQHEHHSIDNDTVNTVKTIPKHTKYNASNKGKAARRRYDLGEKGKCNKAKRNEKYFTSDDGKAAKINAQKAYINKGDGKAAKSRANKTYFGKDDGRAALNKAIKKYSGTDDGRAVKSRSNKTYSGTDDGRAAKRRANKTYSGTDAGRSARSAATEAHAPTEKRRASRKRYARTKKEYMRSYIPFYRDCEKIRIDFSSEKVAGNTNSLLDHTIPSELAKSFKSFEKEIIRGRCLVSPPTQYSSVSARGNMKTATAYYKLMLSRKIMSALGNLSIDDESWITIPGMSKKALKRKHFNPRNRASIILAELAWLKRQQCVTVLKIQLNRLSSYADAIISKMDIQEKESDKMAALLGLQSHQKASEPYMANVSYVDGQPYNYEAEVQKFEDAKASDKKAPSHITYRCNENCILPNNKEDLRNLRKLFDESAKLSDVSPGEFRRFLSKFQWCTKWHDYPERERNDLNPNRMYLYPVKLRNHPLKCYLPDHMHSVNKTICRSLEITMRKFMVHYANPRKFHSIISKAITAHKLMCDIDASSILGDVEYLSKLVKIELKYDDSTVGFDTLSEAREWTADSIEEKLAETAIQGKTSTTTFSHRDLFDKNRNELPCVRCYSCNKLVTPKQSSTLNLNTAKKLEHDPENGKQPNKAFQRFNDFLLEKGIVQSDNDTDDNDNFENHPTRLLHGLSICTSCRATLNKGEIPANSMMNNLYIGETPEVLKVLNPIELMFVSKTKCFQTIVKPGPISNKLPRSERLSAVKGNMIHLPLSTSITADTLYKSATERLFEEAEDNVLLYGKPNKDREVWNHIVDRKKVLAALKWLCENNPNYKDIVVPNVAEDILPHVFGYECDMCQILFESVTERNEHRRGCSNASPDCSDECSNHQSNNLSERNDESYTDTDQCLPNCSQSLDFECEIDSENEFVDQCYEYDSESDLSSDKSDPGVKYPESNSNQDSPDLKSCKYCKEEFNSDAECKTHESICSSVKSDSDQSNTDTKGKPWIEQVPKDSLKDGFRHFRTVGNDAKEAQAKDIFQMLNIGADPIPYYEPNVDCE